jgi:cytochrome P450
MPALVICELMGAPLADYPMIGRHAPALAARLDPSPMRTEAVVAASDRAAEELTQYLSGLIEARRKEPGEDLLSAMIAAEDAGDRLSHDELIATAMLLLIAGHETTANLLGNGLFALLTQRDQWERLRAESRPAVSQHLRVLKDAGLVIDEPVGNRRIYRVDPDALAALRGHLDRFWEKALAAYKTTVEQQHEEEP